MKQKIKIAIVDDSSFFRVGLKNLIQNQNNFEIIIESSNGKELIAALDGAKQMPDIILLDLEMPVMDGIKTAKYLSKHFPEIKILILTIHHDYRIIRHLLDKVNGFLKKDKNIDVVFDAINVIYKYDFYFAGLDFKKIITNSKPISASKIHFTKRELEILKLICQQYTNQKISEKLFISIRTVHGHRENIFKKTNTKNATGLAIYAVKHNLITDY